MSAAPGRRDCRCITFKANGEIAAGARSIEQRTDASAVRFELLGEFEE
jgi:hypothetical protein